MKAAVLDGPSRVPEYADFEEPLVPSGRELVELAAAGIHPVVRSLAAGRHYGSTGAYRRCAAGSPRPGRSAPS